MRYQAPRGTQDILPGNVGEWQAFEAAAGTILTRYGYREIRTPVFEQKELFQRTVGQETDIVQKEMYCFKDRKEREFALRPEGTAPVIRSYIENALWKERQFQKLYYIGPMFRYDRPQKGRYRQFHQVGAEAIGSLSPLVDAEVIALMGETLRAAGVKRTILKLNSLGDRESRNLYAVALKEYFALREKALCPDCRRRLDTNPLRILDCKVPSCGELSRDIPPMEGYLNEASRTHYEQVRHWLEVLEVAYEKDKNLVRGLDYYTRTTFEYHHGELGSSVALGGGGRYDLLVEECGGPDTPAIGFSLGTERVLLAASQDRGAGISSGRKESGIYLVWLGEGALETAFKLANSLRRLITVEMDPENRSLKAQLRQADKLGISHVMILGEQELAEQQVQIKEMATGSQEKIRLSEIEDYINTRIKNTAVQ
ncbi:MAG TPA: histidine--tRNA ligase [archaeon]|nr:histidine--tRNA ligase [archaeon]